jgi:curved DNA-binding protein CbpA
MANPFKVLGILPADSDATVRKAYLSLVQEHPPERSPAEFQRITAAYEQVSDLRRRLGALLFTRGMGESFEEWEEEIRCEKRKERLRLEEIRQLLRS